MLKISWTEVPSIDKVPHGVGPRGHQLLEAILKRKEGFVCLVARGSAGVLSKISLRRIGKRWAVLEEERVDGRCWKLHTINGCK